MTGLVTKPLRDANGDIFHAYFHDDGTALSPAHASSGKGAAAPVYSPGGFFTVAAAFNRPADTTAYTARDLVAGSTTAAVALELPGVARAAGEAVRIERIRLRKSSASLTNASFRIHVFRTIPVLTANDNAAFDNGSGVLSISDIAGYAGTFDVTMNYAGAAGARGVGAPSTGSGVTCEAAGAVGHETSLWIVVEAMAAYAPASAETFTVTIEGARS